MANLIALLGSTLLLISCGQGSPQSPEKSQANKSPELSEGNELDLAILLAGKKLPDCTTDIEGKTYFQISEKTFVYCDGSEWTDISLDGTDGISGENGTDGQNGVDGANALVATATEPSGSNCSNGGTKLIGGNDSNANDTLDAEEITSTAYVCNGANGSNGSSFNSLIKTSTEAAGANCTNAGTKLESGLDNGEGGGAANNGTLETGEVDLTTYVCNGVDGTNGSNGTNGYSSLIKVTNESSGVNCGNGGKKIETGIDNGDSSGTANNGTLEVGEVDATDYVCDGANNLLKLYDSSDNALAYFISHVNFPALHPDSYAEDVNKVGFMVKDLTNDVYTVYLFATTNNVPNSSINDVLSWSSSTKKLIQINTQSSGNETTGFANYTSSDCTGQGYIIHEHNDYGGVLSSYLAFSGYNDFRYAAGLSESSYELSVTGIAQSMGSTPSSYWRNDNTCQTSGMATASSGFPITIETRVFQQVIAGGWYIAP